jgi:hypothetical protein
MDFKVGDIVRLAKDDDSGEPMRVLECNDFANVTFCIVDDDDENSKHYDTKDLELYPETIQSLQQKIAKETQVIHEAVNEIREMIKEIT